MGLIERQARGLYVASRHPFTAEHTLAQVAKRVPGGVLCLLTALCQLDAKFPPSL